jgi:PadR family transcriptional regulator PadR
VVNRKQAQVKAVVERMMGEWKRGMLSYWVLGLLLLRPMYGLQIKKEIESSTQGRMELGASTIYQLLRRLEKKKLLESWQERTTQGPPRTYYRPTAAGREVVRRYLTDVLSPESPISAAISELTARLFQQLAMTDEQQGSKLPK